MKRLEKIFKALSSPKRLELFQRVKACCGGVCHCSGMDKESCISSLARGLDINKATVSHHIKVLTEAGLISLHRKGREASCHVNDEALREIRLYFKV